MNTENRGIVIFIVLIVAAVGSSLSAGLLEPFTAIDSFIFRYCVNADNTGYRFIKTTITDSDTIVAVQEIRFLYQRNDVYVNRACGFRAEFIHLDVQEEGGSGIPFIKEIQIKRDSVVDETKAHLVILH